MQKKSAILCDQQVPTQEQRRLLHLRQHHGTTKQYDPQVLKAIRDDTCNSRAMEGIVSLEEAYETAVTRHYPIDMGPRDMLAVIVRQLE